MMAFPLQVCTGATNHEALISPIWLFPHPEAAIYLELAKWDHMIFFHDSKVHSFCSAENEAFYFQLASLISEFLKAAELFISRILLTALSLSLLNTTANSANWS